MLGSQRSKRWSSGRPQPLGVALFGQQALGKINTLFQLTEAVLHFIQFRVSGWLTNGSRLSCGAKAGGRKRPALRYELVGAQTDASSESRPRQLQALVRPHRTNQRLERRHGNSTTRYTTALSSMCSR